MAWEVVPTTTWKAALQETPVGMVQQALHSTQSAHLAILHQGEESVVCLDIEEQSLEISYDDIPAILAAYGVPGDGWMSFDTFSNQAHYGRAWVED